MGPIYPLITSESNPIHPESIQIQMRAVLLRNSSLRLLEYLVFYVKHRWCKKCFHDRCARERTECRGGVNSLGFHASNPIKARGDDVE